MAVDLKSLTTEEQQEWWYDYHYNQKRPERVPEDERIDWSDVEHIDFFETMTFLNIRYGTDEWDLLENGIIRIIDETDKAIKVRAIKDGPTEIRGQLRRYDEWIPKFLLTIDS